MLQILWLAVPAHEACPQAKQPGIALRTEVCVRRGEGGAVEVRLTGARRDLRAVILEQLALQCLRHAIHAQPVDGGNIFDLARILWEERRFEEGLALHRIAACLEDTNETLSQAYFFAARHLKQTETALQLLRSRFRRFGSRSGQPVRTLVWALADLNRTTEAFAALDEGLADLHAGGGVDGDDLIEELLSR